MTPETGLEVVIALQSLRNGVFDLLAQVLHLMGNDLFFFGRVTADLLVFES